jgi:colanic acid/amylovoran biosynthesis glycosyltransferase
MRRSAGFCKTTERSGEPRPDPRDIARDGTRRLGVVVPEIGLASETFIRWDIEALLPGGTVVVEDPPPGGLTRSGGARWQTIGVPTLAFSPATGDPPPEARRRGQVVDFLRRHRVEVVLIEYLDFAERWVDTLSPIGIPVWVRGHGVDLSARLRDPGRREAYAELGRLVDGVIVPSRTAAATIERCGVPAAKVHVVHYGVEMPSPLQGTVNDRGLRCVMGGRLVPKKAPLLTLEAWRRAADSGTRLTLDVVGDGVLMADVRDQIDRHGLHDRVRLHSTLSHAATLDLIGRADVLLHHAVTAEDGDEEGMPLVILEAMAAGVAVVSTRHAGIPEVITDRVNGRLVDPGDVAAMATALMELAASTVTRRAMGNAARRTIGSDFTHEVARRTLRRLLGLPPAARPNEETGGRA